MFVPRIATEITREWLARILLEHEKKIHGDDCLLKVEEFRIEKGTNPGDNINGELSIVNVKSLRTTKNVEKEITHSLYFKFHSIHSFSREYNKLADSHLKELKIYSEVKETLNKFSAINYEVPPRLRLPEYYYGYSKKEDFVLVMENMKVSEFRINDVKNCLNYSQLKLVIEQLAIWHGLSYAFNQSEEGKKLKLYKIFQQNKKLIQVFKHVLGSGTANAAKVLRGREEYNDMAKLLQNTDPLIKELERLIVKDTSGVRCLVHCDLWNNNILFKYSQQDESVPTEVCFIDWQMCTWTRPIFDLQYLLYSSTSYDIRHDHLDDILILYYGIFITLAGPTLEYYTFEALKRDFNDTKILGFLWGLNLCQGSLSDAAKEISKTKSTPRVRGFRFTLKKTLAAKAASISVKPQFNFLAKGMMTILMEPMSREVEQGNNHVLNKRLLEIFREARESKLLDSIYKTDT